MDVLSKFLFHHARDKGYYYVRDNNTSGYLDALKADRHEHTFESSSKVICRSLSKVGENLIELKETIETLP